MGKPTGFMEFEREAVPYRDPLERLNDYDEINTKPDEGHLQTQGARCMDSVSYTHLTLPTKA